MYSNMFTTVRRDTDDPLRVPDVRTDGLFINGDVTLYLFDECSDAFENACFEHGHNSADYHIDPEESDTSYAEAMDFTEDAFFML